jgi:hypothetical protein
MNKLIIPVYECEHCGKKYFRNYKFHETFCKKNPNNRHKCFQFCDNLIKYKDSDGYTHFLCFANLLKPELYSYIAEKKKIDVTNKIRMPLECDKYKQMYLQLDSGNYIQDEEINLYANKLGKISKYYDYERNNS